jgi:hypothetical protein
VDFRKARATVAVAWRSVAEHLLFRRSRGEPCQYVTARLHCVSTSGFPGLSAQLAGRALVDESEVVTSRRSSEELLAVMLPLDWAWLPDASAGLEFGAALLSLVGAGLAIAQRVRALRKRKAAGRQSGDDDEPAPDADS